jgi:DhnA family fructose-bisphosphate aldolase class Ia
MSGKDLRINRFFRKKKNPFISALDHVMEYGDKPGIEDARNAIKNCLGIDALLIPFFMLKRNWDFFVVNKAPVPVIRINWSSAFYYPLEYIRGFTRIASTVEEAIEAGGLGADLIKNFYTGDIFHEVIENTPFPVFTIGAEKLNTDLEVLKKVYESVRQGARGIIFGMNIFMAKNPAKLVKALNDVINSDMKPEDACRAYNLK